MLPFLGEGPGNPSSLHASGREARSAMEGARRQLARLLGARPRSLVFTGGGSEANNLAIKGVAFAARARGSHVITSAVEHPAVLATCGFLERAGFRVSYLDVDAHGLVLCESLEALLTDKTILISVMLANNEVGTIQPIRELAAMARQRKILFHTDAVQGAGKITVDLQELGVDLASVSAHKLGGPKGVGALYVRKGVELEPLIHGGKQEMGLRAGTENVPAIVGLGKAAELARSRLSIEHDVRAHRDRFEAGIRELRPE